MQGPAGATGATGAQGPGGAAAAVRMATAAECPTGGIVVSDSTTSVPVCNGAAGAAGAQGADGPAGPAGPPGPAGGQPPNPEDVAVANVNNVLVEIADVSSFRPLAISRVGFDVTYVTPDFSFSDVQSLSFPTIKLILNNPSGQLLDELNSWWTETKNGNPIAKTMTIKIQVPLPLNTFVDALTVTMAGSHVVQFNPGTVTTPYVVIQPGALRLQMAQTLTTTQYGLVDLPKAATPTVRFDTGDSMLLHRFSGGDPYLDELFGLPAERFANIQTTILALEPSQAPGSNIWFYYNDIGNWLDDLLEFNAGNGRPMVFEKRSAPNQQGVTQVLAQQAHVVLPVRVNLINPLLVNGNVAPYVWDLVLRVTGF